VIRHVGIPALPPSAREAPASSEQNKPDKGALAMVRRDYAPFRRFLTALIAEIRQRNYSIRTEQVYELWACRFILFNNANNPKQLGVTEVVSFLQTPCGEQKRGCQHPKSGVKCLGIFLPFLSNT